jgi:hypothetical protein
VGGVWGVVNGGDFLAGALVCQGDDSDTGRRAAQSWGMRQTV